MRSTFERIEKFKYQITRVKDTERVPLILVGNKCDKVLEREVSREEGYQMAKSISADFVETSAKTCLNVERYVFAMTDRYRAFYNVVRMIRANREGTSTETKRRRHGSRKCAIL
jgi:GTPase KRas protein